jgi:hypothetical protein
MIEVEEKARTLAQRCLQIGYRVGRRTLLVLLVVFVLLVVLRLALPYIVKSYVNRKINQLPEYDGHVADIDIHLIRGAYTIRGMKIEKTTGKVPVPFFSAPKVDLSVQWRELFHGAVVGEIYVDRGSLNFVKGPTEEESQTEVDKSWIGIVQDLFPFDLNRFEIRQSEVRFRNFHSKPPVDVYLTDLFIVGTNLKNTRDRKERMPADLKVHGTTAGDGELTLDMRMDPMARLPTFDLKAAIEGMNLVALNDFLQAYAMFTVHGGRFRVYVEATAVDGKMEGYVKPFFEDLDVVQLKTDVKNPLELFWKTIVATAAQIFKNQPKDRLATKVPLSGTVGDPAIGLWGTVINLLRNAFIKSLAPQFDLTIHPQDLEKQESEKQDQGGP